MKKVKTILVSQPKPADFTKSPYGDIAKRFSVTIDFEKFFKMENVTASELRDEKLKISEYSAVIITSKVAIDHYFRIAKEMRYAVPDTLKYFCISETVSNYLQNYIQYRKRKIFYTKNGTFGELVDLLKKHKEEKFIFPCSDTANEGNIEDLNESKVDYTQAVMFRTVPADLSGIDINKYDMIVMFSPAGIASLTHNFPDYVQEETVIAGFGVNTCAAIQEAGFTVNISVPNAEFSSMTEAISSHLEKERKRHR